MKRRSNNRRRNNLDFQQLEARQLLAGDLVGPHQVETTLPTGANLVANGDFETFVEGADNFFTESEVPGWNASDAATGQELNIFHYNVDGYNNVLDLDSTTTDFDRVYQDVDTEVDTNYLVTFDFRNHPSANPIATPFTHDFEVYWDNQLVGRFTGGDSWNTAVINVRSSSLDTTRLLFCEIQEDGALTGDGQGALLDNIRVVEAHEVAIANGGFESLIKTSEDQSVFFGPANVPGWSAMATDVADRLLKIQTEGSSEGSQHLNLDTTETNRDIIFTDLATTAGSSYYVTFDMRTDGDQSTNADELRVRWNQNWATTLKGTNDWETYGILVTTDSDLTRLTFLEPGGSPGDGSGPLIDNVQLYKVNPGDLSVDLNGDATGRDATATFVPGAGAKAIGQNITVEQPNGTLDSVVIVLVGATNGANEIVSISNASIPQDGLGNDKIAVTKYSNDTKTLTLSGAATAAEYQAVLRTLTYFNAADSVGTENRTINVTAINTSLSQTSSASIDLNIETNQAAIDDAILTKFATDNNLTTTDLGNGLYAVIDAPGTGQNPTINDRVRVNYNGKFVTLNSQNKLVEGESFDFSSSEGITFPLTGVIQGWQLGIPAFKTGGTGQLLIPSHLAYGTSGQGSIPPNSVLVFDIELLEIIA